MHKKFVISLLASAFISSSALADKVVARYKNIDVTDTQVMQQFNQAMQARGATEQKKITDLPAEMQKNIINGYLTAKIIEDKAKAAGLEKSASFQTKLAQVKNSLLSQEYIEQQINKQLNEADIKKAYDELNAQLKDVKEVNAKHILVADEKTANELMAKLKKGADFNKLAGEFSTDPGSKEKNGDLGYFRKEQMVKEFAEAAFAAKKGELAGPVKTQFGWHVIKVEDKRNAKTPEFATVKPQLEAKVKQEKLVKLIDKLLAEAKIEYKL